jgi:uncharacterized protein YijF (DUF1287 family)
MKRSSILIILVLGWIIGCSAQDNFYRKLADSALTLTRQNVVYDPSYFSIDYPNGDIPAGKGVCTDVIIRTYRKLGIDLQKEMHEDMLDHFNEYPANWGLNKPDKNIDHRRVPNLMVFFERHGKIKIISDEAGDYLPGDIVCWDLGNGITHIGMVANKKTEDYKRTMIIHNIGAGQVLADCLFDFKIIGHYRYE